jgi:hypothetical protein
MTLLAACIACTATIATSQPAPVPPGAHASKLQQALRSAIASGLPSFGIAGGEYRFNDADFEVFDAQDLAIASPQPAKFWFAPGFGIHFRGCLNVSLGNWSVDYDPPWKHRTNGITFQLTNSSDVITEDLTILSSPSMAVTAFNGGGGHIFRRLKIERSSHDSDTKTPVVSRDAMHFSDLRRGPIIEDSMIGHAGDDFFNVHSTLMLLLKCETPTSCIVINPHLAGGGVPGLRPLYGGNSVMSTVCPSDHMSFYTWPAEDMIFHDLAIDFSGGEADRTTAEVQSVAPVNEAALLAEAALLSESVQAAGRWTELTNRTKGFINATVVWRVNFTAPLPPRVFTALAALTVPGNPGGASTGPVIMTVDEISCAKAELRNNVFNGTSCNLGRFKSPGGSIVGNTFLNAKLRNLELTVLLPYFEGPVRLSGIEVRDNVFVGVGGDPIHCGPLCEEHVMRGGQQVQCLAITQSATPCPACPNCSSTTHWASVALQNNTIRP